LNGRTRIYISKEGLIYRKNVQLLTSHIKTYEGRLGIKIKLNPPDKIKRDIDNTQKCLLDSLQHAGVVHDDEQFDKMCVERGSVQAKGKVIVEILELEKQGKNEYYCCNSAISKVYT
jgi:crossover junction endodeoxyribonuclease RusA